MGQFIIEGGRPLHGVVTPQGAKNEALQIVAATLLTREKVLVKNVPNISDVLNLMDLIKHLGVKVEKMGTSSYSFCAKEVSLHYLQTQEYETKASALRGSILLLGPLLSIFGEALIHTPGGDKIGRRGLDTHFNALKDLGCVFSIAKDSHAIRVDASKIKSGYVMLDEASVTGTANVIMASVLLKGKTTIYNAACEPYVQQLCLMLNNMGAKISGIGSNLLTVIGVDGLTGTTHNILSDMIEIGSFIGMAALTQSSLRIQNVNYNQLGRIPQVFKLMGISIALHDDDIIIPPQATYKIHTQADRSILTIYDAPWPGLTPDLLSIILVTAIQAKGTVLIHQKMFESRLFFVDKLISMGAQIILCDPHRASVIGLNRKYQLKGITMHSPDIRAGIALLIAALSAKGQSTIKNIEQIDRGYEYIDSRLRALGACIERVDS